MKQQQNNEVDSKKNQSIITLFEAHIKDLPITRKELDTAEATDYKRAGKSSDDDSTTMKNAQTLPDRCKHRAIMESPQQ